MQMVHQSNGHLDSWTLQLNSTFLKLVLGKQTKYPNNIIIKHKYSSDFMTKLAKKKYLRKILCINFKMSWESIASHDILKC